MLIRLSEMTDAELRQHIHPLHDNIFVECDPVPETIRGLLAGDYTMKREGLKYGRRATVLAVGPGRYHRPFKKVQCIDKFIPVDDVKVGDVVWLEQAAGVYVDPRRPHFLIVIREDYHAVEEQG